MKNDFIAKMSFIKKYKSLDGLIKALNGKTAKDYEPLAKKKKWTTIVEEGKLDGRDIKITFHIKLVDGKMVIENPDIHIPMTEKEVDDEMVKIKELLRKSGQSGI